VDAILRNVSNHLPQHLGEAVSCFPQTRMGAQTINVTLAQYQLHRRSHYRLSHLGGFATCLTRSIAAQWGRY
jgi:hypothetical protein